MGFLSTIGKIGKGALGIATGGISSTIFDAIGAGASAGSQASASNRGTTLQALMDQDRMRLMAGQDQRAGESDTLRKLAQTAYLRSGGAHYGPTSTPAGMLPTFDFGPRPASPEQMTAAGSLEQELLKRQARGPMQLSDYTKQMKPGFFEKFGGILGAGASAFGVATAKKPNVMDTRDG